MKLFLLFFTSSLFLTEPVLAQHNKTGDQNGSIHCISTNNLKESWIIGGEDSSRIFRIDSNQTIIEKTEEINSWVKGSYKSIITIGTDQAIIGTQHHFAILYNQGSVIVLNASRGLIDSCIVSMAYSPRNKRIYIETDENSFVSTDSTFTRYLKFTRSLAHEIRNDSILKEYYSGHLISYVWLPARYATRLIGPAFVKKEHTVIKARKINYKQREDIAAKIEPGDILLKRNDGDFTNLVIPLFWTHTGIYIGNLRLLNSYFDSLPLLNGMKPSRYIKKHYPKVYRKLLTMKDPIVESVTRKGVSVAPLRNIATMDYFAALRPNLSKEDKFLTLLKSFEYFTMHYDFSFDLAEKNALVCSGLIYKCFLTTPVKKGLHFEISSLMGNPFLYPGDIVKKFDSELGQPSQELEFILFYDSNETHKKAFLTSMEVFRKTWER